MLDRGAKGGVHDGLNNDQPRCARGPVQAARPREALANVGTFASHASQGGPPVFAPLARTARATTCKPGKHQSAGQRRSRSSAELSGLRLLKLASNRSGKRFRALLPRVLPNTGLIFDLQDLTCQPIAAHEKLVWCSNPNLPRFQRHGRSDL
jgi:hypothetical protein